MENRERARHKGGRFRPIPAGEELKQAHRCVSGQRECDGFSVLADKHHLELTLEALAVDKRFTALFSDEECNTALSRLLYAGYRF